MKQSAIQFDSGNKIETTRRSRARLIEQNKKLWTEVYRLQQVINNIIEKSVANEFQFISEDEQFKIKYRKDQESQLRYITKLKKQIKTIKSNYAEHQYQQVKIQENQLVYYQRQRSKLLDEKETLTQAKQIKQNALEYHKPINNQTAETMDNYQKTKAQNGELKYKIHQIERQIAKNHKIRQMAKTTIPGTSDNTNTQLMKLQSQIGYLKGQIKKIQQKWKSKIQSLDQEYFSLKQICIDKELEIDKLQRQLKNSDIKRFSIRDEVKVQLDQQRIKSVTISLSKRKEIQDLIKRQAKQKFINIQSPVKKDDFKKIPDKSKVFLEPSNKAVLQKDNQPAPTLIVSAQNEIESSKKSQDIMITTKQGNLSQNSKQKKQLDRGDKKNKIMQSVAVGTSFYYVEQ